MYRNLQTRHDSDLGNDKHKLENIFHLVNKFLSLNNYLKYKFRLVWSVGYVLCRKYKPLLFWSREDDLLVLNYIHLLRSYHHYFEMKNSETFLINIICHSYSELYIYAWSNEIIIESWAVRSFKFQWQYFYDEYFGPGFFPISLQLRSKFGRQIDSNMITFTILGSFFNKRR